MAPYQLVARLPQYAIGSTRLEIVDERADVGGETSVLLSDGIVFCESRRLVVRLVELSTPSLASSAEN